MITSVLEALKEARLYRRESDILPDQNLIRPNRPTRWLKAIPAADIVTFAEELDTTLAGRSPILAPFY